MRQYIGSRLASGCVVSVVDEMGKVLDLDRALHVRNHSPTGFEWGYPGSGPAQLSLAICLDALCGHIDRAQRVYQAFKWAVIAKLPKEKWTLDRDEVVRTIESLEAAHAARATLPPGVPAF